MNVTFTYQWIDRLLTSLRPSAQFQTQTAKKEQNRIPNRMESLQIFIQSMTIESLACTFLVSVVSFCSLRLFSF